MKADPGCKFFLYLSSGLSWPSVLYRHMDNVRRGNGRGGFRGRMRYRGGGRGGGGGGGRGGHWAVGEVRENTSGDWQHDLYAGDDEQEPTSTTA